MKSSTPAGLPAGNARTRALRRTSRRHGHRVRPHRRPDRGRDHRCGDRSRHQPLDQVQHGRHEHLTRSQAKRQRIGRAFIAAAFSIRCRDAARKEPRLAPGRKGMPQCSMRAPDTRSEIHRLAQATTCRAAIAAVASSAGRTAARGLSSSARSSSQTASLSIRGAQVRVLSAVELPPAFGLLLTSKGLFFGGMGTSSALPSVAITTFTCIATRPTADDQLNTPGGVCSRFGAAREGRLR